MEAFFHENSAIPRTAQVALSHLSVELGHLYMADLAEENTDLTRYFARIAAWVDPTRLATIALPAGTSAPASGHGRPRISTCVLIDDYFSSLRSPRSVVPDLLAAASANGLRIDYLARESACAETNGRSLAALTEASLVADPAPNTNGSRPPSHVTGWLCNGTRSEQPMPAAAMRPSKTWTPPKENRARQHSIFLDVELWKTDGDRRIWSCPFLAAVWQLLRLGQLRVDGESPVQPVPVDLADLPDEWSQLPAVVKLEPRAAPFCAYRTFSVLDRRFLDVEHAVRTILSQVVIDASVVDQTVRRAAGEEHDLPLEITDRISYLFLGS